MTDENDVKLDGKSNGYPWLKVYTDLPDNPKLRTLTDTQKWRYVHLYLLAGKADAGGLLALDGELLDAGALAWYLRIDTDTMQSDIDKMMKARLLNAEGEGFAISSFMDEQGSSHAEKREQWRVRQERRRNKLAMLQDEETEQEQDLEQEQEEDLEEEKEKDIDKDKIRSHAPVTRDNAAGAGKEFIIMDFLSSLPTDDKEALETIIALNLEGELTKPACQYWIENYHFIGAAEVLTFLAWQAEQGASWGKAYNVAKKNNFLADTWEVPEGTIHFDNEPPTTYEDVLVNGKWVSKTVVCEEEMTLPNGTITVVPVHRKKTPTII